MSAIECTSGDDLYPSCGREYQSLTSSLGLCDGCTIERVRERYAAEDRRRVEDRVTPWKERTTERRPDSDAVADRQRRHRLQERCRPRSPATFPLDPLAIADEALRALTELKPSLLKSPTSSQRFEIVAEAIRRLSWGPGD